MIRTVKAKKAGELSMQLTMDSALYQWASRLFTHRWPLIPSEHRYHLTLCHGKRFMWFRVAKVGTRTIFRLLTEAGVTLDAEHAMSCHYPVNRYRDYFKFAFVRNPWDRLVSCWHSKVVEENYFKFSEEKLLKTQNFADFVDYVAALDASRLDNHLRPQSALIDLNNIDYLGRFENLGLNLQTIPQENASQNRRDYREYYDEELKQKVARIYQKDLRIFGYMF
jgi:hypothetical protein